MTGRANTVPNLAVYYDGGCPICCWEVRLYTRMDRRGLIEWVDIEALTDADLPRGKTREDLLGRFHAQDIGAMHVGWHIGVDAFARIWRELPVLSWFAWMFRVPGIRQATEWAYRRFLRWQARDRARRNGMPPPAT